MALSTFGTIFSTCAFDSGEGDFTVSMSGLFVDPKCRVVPVATKCRVVPVVTKCRVATAATDHKCLVLLPDHESYCSKYNNFHIRRLICRCQRNSSHNTMAPILFRRRYPSDVALRVCHNRTLYANLNDLPSISPIKPISAGAVVQNTPVTRRNYPRRKPRGQVMEVSKGGYSLKKTLAWDAQTYGEVEVVILLFVSNMTLTIFSRVTSSALQKNIFK